MVRSTLGIIRTGITNRMGPDRYTLFTGSTGLLGRVLLADMARARLPVAVLARPGRETNVRQRIDGQLRHMEKLLQRTFVRPVVLAGELTQPGLGLSDTDRRWVQKYCERVLHCAAYISFKPASTHPQNEPFTTNVIGTNRLAEFCLEQEIREFHHISSAFACGAREGIVLESDGAMGQAFSNDYEASKCQAEESLRALSGLDSLTVYRPSIVVDPTPGSLSIGDRTIYLAFSVYQLLSQRVGLPDPAELLQQLGLHGAERKNIVPADWVSRIIVQILRRPELHRRTYHLTHPTGTPLIDLLTAFRDVLADAGYSSLQRRITESDFGELAGLVEQFIGTFAPYFRDDPRFDQQQLRHALQVCREPNCPDADRSMLQDLARQQLTRKVAPEPVGGNESTLWDRLQQEIQSVSPAGAPLPATLIGLILTGPGGGDWILGINQAHEPAACYGGAAACRRQVYMSAFTWGRLLTKQLSFTAACRQGQVLLETIAPAPEEDALRDLEETFERILKLLMEQVIASSGAAEVSLHGI